MPKVISRAAVSSMLTIYIVSAQVWRPDSASGPISKRKEVRIMEKQKPIKALKNFRRLLPEAVLKTSTHVFAEIYNNPNFAAPQAPAPPVDQATLSSANDALSAA